MREIVLDTETKQSKGYGFVTFADAEDAQKAADEFNGKIFLGRRMKIEIAQPRSREIVANDGMEGKRKSTISAEAAAIKKARRSPLVCFICVAHLFLTPCTTVFRVYGQPVLLL